MMTSPAEAKPPIAGSSASTANGSLTGFGGGLALKQALLDLERDHPGPEQRP